MITVAVNYSPNMYGTVCYSLFIENILLDKVVPSIFMKSDVWQEPPVHALSQIAVKMSPL